MGGESGVWNLNSGRSMNYMWKFLDNLTSVCLFVFSIHRREAEPLVLAV